MIQKSGCRLFVVTKNRQRGDAVRIKILYFFVHGKYVTNTSNVFHLTIIERYSIFSDNEEV